MSVNGKWQKALPSIDGSLSCLLLIAESSQVHVSSVDLNLRSPFSLAFIPGDSSVLRRRSSDTRYVVTVPPLRENSQIGSSIVETVPVDVVNISTHVVRSESYQDLMQVEPTLGFASRAIPAGVTSLLWAIAPGGMQMPSPLIHKAGVGLIHDSVCADRAVSAVERNAHGTLRGAIIPVHRTPPTSGARPLQCATTVGASSRQLYQIGDIQ